MKLVEPMVRADRRRVLGWGRALPALACGAWLAPTMARPATAWLPAPNLPDATLQNHQGRDLRLLSDVMKDRVLLVHFFYTGCATVCPPQTALLRELRRRLDVQAPARNPLFVGLSVDPLGDGPAQLRAYLQRFDIQAGREAGWVWLTGHPTAMARVLRGFGVATAAPDQHPNLLWLGDTRRERWTRTASLQSPEQLAARLAEVTA